jgi:osmoprotectant transport system substrate-binding protein
METEVTGTQAPTSASPDLQTTLTNLEKFLKQKGLTHLDPANAVDQNAFAVSKSFATQHHLTTLTDLGKSGISVTLAATPECPQRPFCKPAAAQPALWWSRRKSALCRWTAATSFP